MPQGRRSGRPSDKLAPVAHEEWIVGQFALLVVAGSIAAHIAFGGIGFYDSRATVAEIDLPEARPGQHGSAFAALLTAAVTPPLLPLPV